MKTYSILYKVDSKGKTRIWYCNQQDDKYQTVSGLIDGKQVTSEWTTCLPTNEGKSNYRDPISQCSFEIEALYNDKLSAGGYHKELENSATKLFFEPMLAAKWSDVKEDKKKNLLKKSNKPEVLAQPKLDGVRCIYQNGKLTSRNGKEIVATPYISDSVKSNLPEHLKDIVLDGELYNHQFRNDFNKIISLVRKTKPEPEDFVESKSLAQYWIYDCYVPSSPKLNYSERMSLVKDLSLGETIFFVETKEIYSIDQLDEHYNELLTNEFEGQMIRINASAYEVGKRSKNLLKRKSFFDEEFEIVDIHEGKGNWAGFAKAIEFKAKTGAFTKCGIKGERGEFAKDLLQNKSEYIGGTVTVRYPNLTPDGVPRFGVAYTVFKGKRDL
jgi:DNA ligase-1